MGALRGSTSLYGKGSLLPVGGLTGMLGQLCLTEALACMTLQGECNSLNAEAFSCCPLLAGLAARQVQPPHRT